VLDRVSDVSGTTI